MTYEIIYSVTVIGLIVTGILLAVASWLLYKHLWYGFVDWLDGVSDKGMLWTADRVLGEHEIINKGGVS